MRNLSLTINQLTRKSRHHFTLSVKVLWRRRKDEAAGVDALEAVVRNKHTGGSGYMFTLPSGLKQGWASAVVCVTELSALGPHCSTP